MRISKRIARKESLEHGFRSKFEFDFSKQLKQLKLKAKYEDTKLNYIVPEKTKKYTPDWTIREGFYIETKGQFTASDRAKMLWVREHNPTITVYLLFQNSKVTLSKLSKTTYAEWCNKNNIEWADIKDIKKWKGWFKC
jgi:hypothetical protein